MYKVHFNQTLFRLLSTTEPEKQHISNEHHLVAPYAGKSKFLLQYLDLVEKSNRYQSITLHTADLPKLIHDFESLFRIVEAGGGLVQNEQQQVLLIYRRGFWDLPKGKIDPGETKEQAAVREVQEETGLQNVVLGNFLTQTDHIYRDKKEQRCIKRTYWYTMTTTDQILIPQAEEDIEKAVWMDRASLNIAQLDTYPSIKTVFATSNFA